MSDVDVIDEGVDVVQLDDVVRGVGAGRGGPRAHRTIVRRAWGMLAMSVAIQVLATAIGVWLALWAFGAAADRCGPAPSALPASALAGGVDTAHVGE